MRQRKRLNGKTVAIEKQPSCDDVFEPALLPVDIARARLAEQITPVAETRELPLRQSLGCVVARPIVSPIDVPAYTNSAMDGYAVNSEDIPASGERNLQLLGTAWAGRPVSQVIQRGQAVRIMTGGMMPEGTDTVVIQEHVQALGDDQIRIDGSTSAGRNVRRAR